MLAFCEAALLDRLPSKLPEGPSAVAPPCWVISEATWGSRALNGDGQCWLSVRLLCRVPPWPLELCRVTFAAARAVQIVPELVWEQPCARLEKPSGPATPELVWERLENRSEFVCTWSGGSQAWARETPAFVGTATGVRNFGLERQLVIRIGLVATSVLVRKTPDFVRAARDTDTQRP